MNQPRPPVSENFLKTLDHVVTAAVCLAAALRPLSMGQPNLEVETSIIHALVWFGAFVWLLRGALAGKLELVRNWLWLPLLAYAGFTGLGVLRAWATSYAGQAFAGIGIFSDGNGQAALDLGMIIAGDLLLFVLAAHHFRDRLRMRLLLSCLLAGLATVTVYSLYQRGYGLDYLRQSVRTGGEQSVARIAGSDETQQRLLQYRLDSERIYGPFSYPNALAGYLLLLAPLAAGLPSRKNGWARAVLCAVCAGGVLAFSYSGSKAGLLAGTIAALAGLLLHSEKSETPLKARLVDCASGLALVLACALALRMGTEKLFGLKFSGSASAIAGQTVFGIALFLGLRYLAGRVGSGKAFPKPVRVTGIAAIACAVIGGVVLIAGAGPFAKGEKLAGYRQTVAVRQGYWEAAARMIADHPLRGVGLDNFGSRYTQYKSPEAWAVKKVHNHYLQLATDGGLPLVAAFAAFWIFFFQQVFSSQRSNPETTEPEVTDARAERKLRRLGIGIGATTFLLTLYMFAHGLFGGLAWDFFFSELWSTPGSRRAFDGDNGPLLIHGLFNIAILPAAWITAFLAVWKLLAGFSAKRLAPWLALGVAAALLHGFADFHLQLASISFVLWCVAGLALAGLDASLVSVGRTPATVLAIGALLGTWLLAAQRVEEASQAKVAELAHDSFLSQTNPSKRAESLADAEKENLKALALRPRDATLHHRQASLLLSKAALEASSPHHPEHGSIQTRTAAVQEWKQVVACDPYFASGWVNAAKFSAMLLKSDRQRAEETASLYRQALRLHPWKPTYDFEFAMFLIQAGKREDALNHFAVSLQKDAKVTDERARLSPEQRYFAERQVQFR